MAEVLFQRIFRDLSSSETVTVGVKRFRCVEVLFLQTNELPDGNTLRWRRSIPDGL